jgi:hypothetical protein
VVVTTDVMNIYLIGSEYQTIFFKFDSSLKIVSTTELSGIRIFKGTSGKLNLLGAYIYGTTMYFGLGGSWLIGAKEGTVVMKSSLDYDFTKYTCGLIVDDIRSWDTDWNPTFLLEDVLVSPFTIATTVTKTTIGTTVGANFVNWPWPLVHEAFSFSLRTISFY